MKSIYTMALASAALLAGSAPTAAVATSQEPYYEVNRLDSRGSSSDYRPGEVIVKFRPAEVSKIRMRKSGRRMASAENALDRILDKYSATDAVSLMPLSGKSTAPVRAKAFNGREVADTDLSGLYFIRFDATKAADIRKVTDELQQLPSVEFAEPNYIIYSLATSDPSAFVKDPMYSQQWGIPAIGLDKLWNVKPISAKRPVIAILDTGVDIEHPDLKENIWTNSREASGADDKDDDGNGFTDDLHGWDFVNNTARMRDNNGHGTHCAGIAAACGGNGKGIAGANPDALIMPLTVMQSDGTGDIATIIKAVDYARANGADILSMSLGTYANSTALREALGKAYQKSILVAAAGNDQKCIYNHLCPVNKMPGAPMFPAAYNFVLGVEASSDKQGSLAGFSNFDQDGPILTQTGERDLFNYELRAPGTSIMSTFPGGKYRQLNGTSMACPLTAGAISRLLMTKEYGSKEELFGDLIYSSKGNIDIFGTYGITEADRKPTLSLVTYRIDDVKGGDGDGRPDAGETILIYPTFRNTWGTAKNIKYSIRLAETEDPEIVKFDWNNEDKEYTIDRISSYATIEAENPLVLTINPNCVDGRHICLVMTATCDNMSAPLEQEIMLTAENGVEIGGIIRENTTLTPDKNYIVTTMLGVPNGVTLTILPGTVLNFKDGTAISVAAGGKVLANGEPGNMIRFQPATHSSGVSGKFRFGSQNTISYVDFSGFNDSNGGTDWMVYTNLFSGKVNVNFDNYIIADHCNFDKSNIFNSSAGNPIYYSNKYSRCNLTNNTHTWGTLYNEVSGVKSSNVFSNRYQYPYSNETELYSLIYLSSTPEIFHTDEPSYFGSSRFDIVRKNVWDIHNPMTGSFGEYDLSNMLTRPVHDAHGIVWKVVVNGYDAQDEFDMLPPLGVGTHKFEVYFNRRMNQKKTPMLAMGVRPPYTQTAISDKGSWRTEVFDGDSIDIYTAYLEIKGKDNFDGLNTIYVNEAEDDEYFEIPVEDVRFRVNVQSAGSMSEGFEAEPGLGRVTLTWENPEENFDDMLGYNMYRYEIVNDSTQTEPVRINESLLTEETLTDFDVVPGHRYAYYYKVMRTDMQENSPSKTVAVTPLTASKGDANGSMSVDVLDVITEVNYMIGADPQPFIFEAADVNSDADVDILDVVSTVNIILHKQEQPAAAPARESSATYYVSDGKLHINSPVNLAGLQLTCRTADGSALKPTEALTDMETMESEMQDARHRLIAFSLSGKKLSAGDNAVVELPEGSEIEGLILSDAAGRKVVAVRGNDSGIGLIVNSQLKAVGPNPCRDYIDVPVVIGEAGEHLIRLTISGLEGAVSMAAERRLGLGEHTIRLNTSALPAGFHILTMSQDGITVGTAKIIKK